MGFHTFSDVHFFTATALNWQHAFKNNERKKHILNTLKWLSDEQRVHIYGFVIMPNHVHLIWKHNITDSNKAIQLTQGSLLKYTSKIIFDEMPLYEKMNYLVNAKDRKFQLWERNPLWILCYYDKIIEQKLNYIHNNPCDSKWKLASKPDQYEYSSADFYLNNRNDFGFLKNIFFN